MSRPRELHGALISVAGGQFALQPKAGFITWLRMWLARYAGICRLYSYIPGGFLRALGAHDAVVIIKRLGHASQMRGCGT